MPRTPNTSPRKKTKKQQVLEALTTAGTRGITGKELIRVSSDYGNMIHALRTDGHNIQTMAIVGGSSARYILHP